MIDGRLVVANVVDISLQRTHLVNTWRDQPLPSYGAAPLVSDATVVLASVGLDEGFWIAFQRVDDSRQAAIRICVEAPDVLDAVTGGPWEEGLSTSPQNYVVAPPQFALDGIALDTDHAQQFIGASSRQALVNCRQLRFIVVPRERTAQLIARGSERGPRPADGRPQPDHGGVEAMIRQRIAPDDHPGPWDVLRTVTVRVTILTPAEFKHRTGRDPVEPLNPKKRYAGRRFP